MEENKKRTSMNLLIAILMMLGLNCTQDDLKDQKFCDENKALIEKANEVINTGVSEDDLKRGGIVITNDTM